MPFGLKNTWATYRRLTNEAFKPLMGTTMEVYVDDMLTTSLKSAAHTTDLGKPFQVLRNYNICLNPTSAPLV
ncbi:Retrovirus-related Pol polyprotein from transposon 17.6-like protein [Drosera capensis]